MDAAEARACGVKAVQAAVSGEAGSGCAAIRRTADAPYASESFITPLSTVAKVSLAAGESVIKCSHSSERAQKYTRS